MPRSDETLPDPPERGDLDTHDRTCRRIADARDVEVLAVDHRRAPRHPYPAAIEDVAAVLRWAPPAAVAGDSAGWTPDPQTARALRDEGDAYAHRLAQTGAHVTHRQEPGLEHGFIQGMDLTSPEAATAQERLFDDITALIHE